MTHLRVNLSEEWFISIDIIATDNQSVPVWIIFRSENIMKKRTGTMRWTPMDHRLWYVPSVVHNTFEDIVDFNWTKCTSIIDHVIFSLHTFQHL